MIEKVRIDENTEAFRVPGGIVITRMASGFYKGRTVATHMLFIPMGDPEAAEFISRCRD